MCTQQLFRFPVTQSTSLSVTFKQAEELANRSTAPSATPASTLLTSHKSVANPREASEPHLPQGQGAGGRRGVTGRQRGDQQQHRQPWQPLCVHGASYATPHLERSRRRPAGQTAGQTRRACRELWAGHKPSSRAAPPVLQWLWLAAWERDLGSALGGRPVPNPKVYSLGREVIRNSCAARWFILMF